MPQQKKDTPDLSRMVLEIPSDLKKWLHLHAVQKEKTMRSIVINLLEKEQRKGKKR